MTKPDTVAAVIPTIPPRREQLARAVCSVMAQRRPVDEILVAVDTEKQGAGPTRTRAMLRAETEWIAFLDDDDEWYPEHIEVLLATADETAADVVYPWYDVIGGQDPLAMFEGVPWDDENPHLFPVSYLVRTELAHLCHFPAPPEAVLGPHGQPENPNWTGDDWPFIIQLLREKPKVVHVNQRTWAWHHWGVGSKTRLGNTSGRPDRVMEW